MKLPLFILGILMLSAAMAGCNKDEATADPYKPFIVLKGSNPTWSPLGEPYEDAGAEAYDITASRDTINITHRLQVVSNVNVDVVGSYAVRFNVSDEAGNSADEVVRTVYVNIF
jgi:hypothetical protein